MAFVTVTLMGGPLDQQESSLFDPGDKVFTEGGVYIQRPSEPTIYDWSDEVDEFTDDPEYVAPLPEAIVTHGPHLRDYLLKDPATITNAESVHAIKDVIRALHFLNRRLETEV